MTQKEFLQIFNEKLKFFQLKEFKQVRFYKKDNILFVNLTLKHFDKNTFKFELCQSVEIGNKKISINGELKSLYDIMNITRSDKKGLKKINFPEDLLEKYIGKVSFYSC